MAFLSSSASNADADLLAALQNRTAELEQQLQQCQLELSQRQPETAEAGRLEAVLARAIVAIRCVRVSRQGEWVQDYGSPGCAAVLGYAAEELAQDAGLWRSRVLPIDLEALSRSIQQVTQQDAHTLEYRFHHPSGELRWISATLNIQWQPETDDWMVTAVETDMTARTQKEEALREQAGWTQTLLDAVPDAIFMKDGQGRWLTVNQQARALFRLSEGSYWGKTDLELAAADPVYCGALRNCGVTDAIAWQKGSLNETEEVVPQPGGSNRILSVRKIPLFHPNGSRKGLVVVAQDVTERKQLEHSLQISEARLQRVLERVVAFVGGFRVFPNRDWEYDYFSPGCEAIFGYSAAELQSDKFLWMSRIVAEDFDRAVSETVDDIFAERPVSFEYRFRHKDGSLRWINSVLSSQRDESANCWVVTNLHIDITERKQIELNLAHQQAQLQALLENLPLEIWAKDRDNRVFVQNSVGRQRWGDELGIVPDINTVPLHLRQSWQEEDQRAWSGEVVWAEEEDWVQGEHRFYSKVVAPIKVGDQTTGLLGVTIDITERKRLQLALQESQEKLGQILDSAIAAVTRFQVFADGQWRCLYRSAGCEILFGYTAAELLSDPHLWTSRVPPEDQRLASIDQCLDQIRAQNSWSVEYRFLHQDGQLRWISATLTSRWDPDTQSWIVTGIATDITPRKRLEAERESIQAVLQEKQQMIEQITESTTAILYVYDVVERRNIYVNHQITAVLGYTPSEIQAMGDQMFVNLVHPDDLLLVMSRLEQCMTSDDESIVEVEYRVCHVDGQWRWLQSRDRILNRTPEGAPRQIIGTAVDITRRKQLELALQESETRLSDILDSAIATITSFQVSNDGRAQCLYRSAGSSRLFGYTSVDFAANPDLWLSRVPPEDHPLAVFSNCMDRIRAQQPWTVAYRFFHKDGSLRWIESTLTSRWDALLRSWIVTSVETDITRKKQLEAERSATEAILRKYERIVSDIPDAVGLIDRNYIYQIVNHTYQRWNRKEQNEIVGHPISDLVSEERFQRSAKPRFDRCLAGETVRTDDWFDSPTGRRFLSITYSPYVELDGSISGVVVTKRDLTSLKQAEEALAESEMFLRSIYDHTQVSLFITDVTESGDFRYVGLNPVHASLTGVSNLELRDKTPEEMFPPDVAAVVRKHYQDCLEAGTSMTYEEQLCFRGQNFWWLTTLTPLRDGKNRIYRLVGSALDITARKQAEADLQLQVRRSQLFADIALTMRQSLDLPTLLQATVTQVHQFFQADRVLVLQLNPDGSGSIVEEVVSPGWSSLLGQTILDPCLAQRAAEWCQQGWIGAIADLETAVIQQCYADFLRQLGVQANLVVPLLVHRAGTDTILHRAASPSPNAASSALVLWGLLIVHQCEHPRPWTEFETELLKQLADQVGLAIAQTELVQALQESEEQRRLALDLTHTGSWDWHIPANRFIWNDNHYRLMGLAPGQVEASYQVWHDHVHPEDAAVTGLKLHQALQNRTSYETEYRVLYPDGSTHWILEKGRGIYDESGHPVRMLGVMIDITDRKQAEETLRRQAEREQTLNRVVQTIRNSLDLKTIFATAVQEIALLLQVDSATVVQYLPEQNEWLHVAEFCHRPGLASLLEMRIAGENNPLSDQLKQLQIVRLNNATVLDDETNRSMAEQFPAGWLLVPLPNLGGEQDCPVWGSLSLMRSLSQISWQDWEVELAQAIADQLAIAIQQARLFQQVQDLNQELQWRVQKRTTQLNLALSMSRMGTWEWDLRTNEQRWSPENYALFGFHTDETGRVLDHNNVEVSSTPTYELFKRCLHPEELPLRVQLEQEVMEPLSPDPGRSAKFWERERQIIWPDGSLHWHYTRSAPIYDEQGHPIKLMGVSMDITHRKQAELDLRNSQERFAKVFHASPIGIAIATLPEGRLIDVNESYLQLLGYEQHEVLGQSTLDLNFWQMPQERDRLLQALMQQQSVRNLEVQFYHRSGQLRTGIFSFEKIELGGQTCVLKMLYDISDRKLAEEKLRASLAEKEVLLKEIHHRVKNNLQIVSSLLRMQSRQTTSDQVINQFREAQNRVQSMALIHEQLYQAPDLAGIDFGHYFRILTNNLFRSYGASTARIVPTVQAEGITLPIDIAIPCGLIVNELVSNVLKYAFPDQQAGQVWIQLQADSTGDRPTLTLTVADNGVGMPEGLDLNQVESLGLSIVSSLTRQLDGTLRVERNAGTAFRLTFPAPSPRREK